jgi:phytoene dehydrogenase-like protein
MPDIIIIGGGVNGLVAAAMLARAKKSVVVLERREETGGAAASIEIAPGFHAPALSHAIGPVCRAVSKQLRLERAGLEVLTPDPALTSIGSEHPLVFHRDAVLTAGSIARLSGTDAARWREFLKTSQRLATVVAATQTQPAPDIDDDSRRSMWSMLGLGRRARKLGRRDLVRLMRWTTMPVADVLDDWFEHETVKAAIAAHAIFGHFAGPRSAGTGAMLLQRLAADPMPVGSGITARGGPAGLARTLEKIARQAGADIRTNARVRRVLVERNRAGGVVTETGEIIEAPTIVSAVDPRQTFTSLVEPVAAPPTFVERMRHYRVRGVTAKINLALSAPPMFELLGADDVPLRGRLLIAPSMTYLERAFDAAKYGAISPEPWLEMAVPSVIDPSLAPAGQHVMSIAAHFAPRRLAAGSWSGERETLVRTVLGVLDRHAPSLRQTIVGQHVLTPEDLEDQWGLSGGHIFHGEMTLDQLWMARPLLGWARHETPIRGLFLASAGTHPGGGLTGLPGWLAARRVLAARR